MFKSYFNNKSLEKVAFEINIDPASILGTAVGLGVARKIGKNKAEKKLNNNMSGFNSANQIGYYQQVENLNRDVQIVFTPLGVLYVLKEGPSELVVDSIDIGEMSAVVRRRYENKDEDFFKNVMMNKIRSDIHLVEGHFAGRMMDRHNNVSLNKQASSIMDIVDTMEKIASSGESSYSDYITEEDPIIIRAKFSDELDINKVAGMFGEPLKFPNILDSIDNIGSEDIPVDKLKDPVYLSKASTVKYLPDRVLFIADDLVMAQLSIANMNEDGFKAFKNNDDNFFYKFFSESLGVRKPSIADLFKQASEVSNVEDIFVESMVHIEVYYSLFNERFGAEWLTYDPEILIDAVEKEFGLTEPISELVINKLCAIQAINNPEGFVFKNVQAFEKMVRIVNSKPIDFGETERNLSLGEFVFALRVFQEITPFTDVYDQFSQGVGHYVADVLAGQNRRLINVVSSGSEKKFMDWLDEEVRERIAGFLYNGLPEDKLALAISSENLIVVQSNIILEKIRKSGEIPVDFREFVEDNWKNVGVIVDFLGEDSVDFIGATTKNIDENIAVDVFIKHQEEQLLEQSARIMNT